MKKINALFGLFLITMLVVGCKKEETPNYAQLLQGTWVNTMVNGQPILTDASFSMEFKADNTELYAIGFQLDENNKSWKENNNYTYSLSDNLIHIDGTDVLGNTFQMVFNIQSINEQLLTFSVSTFKVNGESIPDTKIYTCQKVVDDFSSVFTGVWYGRCTTEGAADSLYHYWEYFADGTYNYYCQDENSAWIKKLDNEGQYFLYGHLMVSNYSHDLLSGGTGLAFECWNFTLEGNTMEWKGLRENNITITYKMEKVASPPPTLK